MSKEKTVLTKRITINGADYTVTSEGKVFGKFVQGIVTGALHILVKKQKGHHLYAIHAAKKIRKHVSITSSIILRKRRMQRRKRFVQSRVRE